MNRNKRQAYPVMKDTGRYDLNYWEKRDERDKQIEQHNKEKYKLRQEKG